jgi:transcriptional regulator with PAS, ATPase and Fis domain
MPLHPAFSRIATVDSGLIDAMVRAERMARANSPILITGETGTGKELFARAVHECSAAAGNPFIAVNCGTLTRELAASELLGYEAGAFTGASGKGRRGKFEEADGGTLFLDEIGELPPDVQVHLLRILQDNIVIRVGGNAERQVHVRVIAATHRDLERDVADGRFRSDLLFRLRILNLNLPPLRARRGDIELLITRHLQRLQATYGLGAKRVAPELLEFLARHPWPGNVRELHGLLESMYILSDRAVLTPADLPVGSAYAFPAGNAAGASVPRSGRLDATERDLIVAAIAHNAHNMSAAARELGTSRSTLYRKMKLYGIAARAT